jgi:hypothetical protein
LQFGKHFWEFLMKKEQTIHREWKLEHADEVASWPNATRQSMKRKYHDAIEE